MFFKAGFIISHSILSVTFPQFSDIHELFLGIGIPSLGDVIAYQR
ncbi:hypothetical protein CRENPOLYSF1_190110 [Crenothrix polyspora]|uniref:Uncharacterized protein n=1 Tax=Crenothrix polyspora TaxID=360316 RepID=A0A1R4H5E7_9GAMM|nr:hypothetical protein CRENPOLYSF1_190110 [Crenothrix polyspora]